MKDSNSVFLAPCFLGVVDCCEAFSLLPNLENIGKGGPCVREWCRMVLREQDYGDGGSYKSWSFRPVS